jgi:hypothetical protein
MVTPELLVDAVASSLAGDGGPAWFEVWVDDGRKQIALVRHDGDLHQLLGWSAPDDCAAVAVVAGGQPRAISGPGGGPPPEVPPGRVRLVAVVDREGGSAACTSFADGSEMQAEGGEGRLSDAMRRSLGLATPPPPVGSATVIGHLWLMEVVAALERSGGPLGWEEVAASHPAVVAVSDRHALSDDERDTLIALSPRVWTWEWLRRQTAAGAALAAVVSPEEAAWMDDGMFARCALDTTGEVLCEWPRIASALEEDAALRLTAALDEAEVGCMGGTAPGYTSDHG